MVRQPTHWHHALRTRQLTRTRVRTNRQGFTISLLVAAGIIHDTRLYSADQLASGLQDFLVCIEMFLAAVAHKFAFPYQVRRHALRLLLPASPSLLLPLLHPA